METFKDKLLQILKNINSEYFTVKQIYGILQTHSTAERRAVTDALTQLEKDCQLIYDARNHRYRIVKEGDYGVAEFCGNARGFGFILSDDGDDLFVPANKTNGAFHKDTVMYKRIKGTTDEAEIVKIVSRGMTHIVGTYDKSNNARFVLPDDQRFASDIYIQPKRDLGAKNGQKVVARITVFPDDNRNCPEGEIVEVLGFAKDKNVDILSVARSFGLSQDFPPAVQKRAEAIAQTLSESDLSGRRDLRGCTIFTIDGEDAKDLDDAVSIVKNADGTFTLGVHIADVSHYVKSGDDIDKEAFARGTSVYLPETVFPMLPRELSNGICSLFEKVDRLTLTCEMTINSVGKVVGYDVYPSVINSCHRMTYTAVQAILDGAMDSEELRRYSDIVQDLFTMKELAEILQRKRDKRGNIEFNTKEVYFEHDAKGRVVDVKVVQNSFSHQLIEEFMIVANETVAEYAETCCYPFVYRVHAKPDEAKLAVLLALMRGLGINVKRSQEIHNSVLQDALLQAKCTPFFNLVNDVMLRTMQKAKYSDVNTGHFGLASKSYCHFTSPIRRYPDLVVHRVLKAAISGKMTDKAFRAYEDMCYDAAKQSSLREKIADEAERKADDVKKCAYAERVIGKTFSAIISGVTERGIYAELDNTVEGFISVDKLGSYLSYNPQQFCLFNDAVKYSLGDAITIRVASVNRQACKIDFDIMPAKVN
ncbi:MAG: ribonuclease R [Clostridiales bacterium]|nr:ribonuclease R [Clostridiales bacterium]